MKTSREMIEHILDAGHYYEIFSNLRSYNYLNFDGYEEKIVNACERSGEKDSVIVVIGRISGYKCVMVLFEPLFISGSMGVVAGEKILRAFKLAIRRRLPVIVFVSSSGARVQEGIVSLVQMIKTSSIVYKHAQKGLLYISVINEFSLGGVTASFVSLADIIIGIEGAIYGFTGKRIIEKSITEELPDDFQTVEYVKGHGMIDMVVKRSNIKMILARLLCLHEK